MHMIGRAGTFSIPHFLFCLQPTQFLSAADYLKSGCLTSAVLLTTGADHSSWPRTTGMG